MPKVDDLKFIRYRFQFASPGGEPVERIFTVFFEKKSLDLVQPVREEEPTPEWTQLGFSKCRNCPLSESEYKHCPTARALVDVVEFFSALPSFQEAKISIEAGRRTTQIDGSVQEGLRSLMGLIMPMSGCPILGQLKPGTFLHLPFSDTEETTFKVVATYLLSQYFVQRFGGTGSFDLAPLKKIYEELHDVNVDFLGRLRAASNNDANLNGLIGLDVFAMAVPRSIENQLDKFTTFFIPPQEGEEDGSSCQR